MNQENQPSVQPSQPMPSQPEPAPQPPFGDAPLAAPKKKKTGLIIGIIIGALLLLGLIGLAIWYFVIWQSPQNVMTRAIAKTFTTEQAITSGSVSVETDNANVSIDIKSASDLPKGKAEATVKVKAEGLDQAIEMKLEGVVADDGTVYFRMNDFEKAIDSALQAFMKYSMSLQGKAISDGEIDQYKQAILKQYQPVIDDIDGQWIKISKEDFKLSDSESLTCLADAVEMSRNDKTAREELAKAYRDNPAFIVKDNSESKDGLRGFDITIDKSISEKLSESLKNTAIGKKMSDCNKESSTSSTSSSSESVDPETYRIWVDMGRSEIRKVEFATNNDGTKVSFNLNIEPGKTEAIDTPSDAKSVKELQSAIQAVMPAGDGTDDEENVSGLSILGL